MTDRLGVAQRVVVLLMVLGFAGMLSAALTVTFKNRHVVVQAPSSAPSGMAGDAVGALMRQAAQDPKNQDVLVRLVDALMAGENWQAAETFVNRAITLDINNPHLYHLLSQIEEKLGHAEKAREAMKKAESLSPAADSPMPQQPAKGPLSPDMARKVLEAEKATARSPKDARRWTELGDIYFDTNQTQPAITAYEQSLALAPDNPDVLTDLGIMYRNAGQYEQAVASFRKASKLDVLHEKSLFNEGVVLYYDLHRKEDAVRVWRRLLRINPDARAPNGLAVSEILRQVR
ncbi:MAG: tetratricopeptide repeat protein [Desulfovibrio sp.]|jgi:Flp pilus assembly protein TadD|nr:tetratricopeptide repeat protein [Desulfovibrio sp.]